MLASVACRDVYLYAEEARWMECVDDERDVWDLPLMMSELGAGWLLVHPCGSVSHINWNREEMEYYPNRNNEWKMR